jgi:hypothetical protein
LLNTHNSESSVTDKAIEESDQILSVLLYETADGWQEFRYRESGWTEAYIQLEVLLE